MVMLTGNPVSSTITSPAVGVERILVTLLRDLEAGVPTVDH